MSGPTWPPRTLTTDEREVLDLLLSADFEGAAALRRQSAAARSVGGCGCGCPSVELLVPDPSAEPALSREQPRECGR